MSRGSGPVRIGVVLPTVLEEHGVREQVERMGALDLWASVVGEHVAGVSRAKAVDGATLVVAVKNSAWLMELSMMKRLFLERVNERLDGPPLERLVFVLSETD